MTWKLSEVEKQLLKVYVGMRFIIWLVAFVSEQIVIHEYTTDLILKDHDSHERTWIAYLFGCLLKWDAIFYAGIAQHDYQYLKNHAFFPFFPVTMRSLSEYLLIPFNIRQIDAILLTGVILNFIVNGVNVVLFYRCSKVYFRSHDLAKKSAALLIISPASVFFSAPYTETFFCFTTFLGYYYLHKDRAQPYKNILTATVSFSLGAFIKSNGFINSILIGYPLMHKLIAVWAQPTTQLIKRKFIESLKIIAMGLFCLAILVGPFIITMYHPYYMYCTHLNGSVGVIKPAFCFYQVPNAFNYLQDRYWDVGFLTSWKLHKAFFIAFGLPMLILMYCVIYKYLRKSFFNTLLLGIPRAITGYRDKDQEADPFLMTQNIPSVILTIINFVINAFFAHVQVSSRINSGNPMVYWFPAYFIQQKIRKYYEELDKKKKVEEQQSNGASSHSNGNKQTTQIQNKNNSSNEQQEEEGQSSRTFIFNLASHAFPYYFSVFAIGGPVVFAAHYLFL